MAGEHGEQQRPARRGPGLRIYGLALLVILLIAGFPALCVLASTSIADLAGCRVDEGGTYPCLVLGHDIGDLLSMLFVMGWLMLITIPFGIVAIAVWLLLLIFHVIIYNVQRRQ